MAYYSENEVMEASFAERSGQLLTQYEHFKPEGSNERYDATHALVLAQALLVTCVELFKNHNSKIYEWSQQKLTDIPQVCGLRREMVKCTFPCEELTLYTVIEHLRNAVSHPLYPKETDEFQKTGFRAIKEDGGQIRAFKFFHSPDFKNNKNENFILKSKNGKIIDNAMLEKYIENRHRQLKLKKGVVTAVDLEDRVELHFDGKLLMRVFEIEIPIKNLKDFVRILSSELFKDLEGALKEAPEQNKEAVSL